MKVMLVLGLCYGLRGGKEIVQLKVKNLIHGHFPRQHPLHGQTYVEVHVENSKSDRLSVNNTVIKPSALRMPVLPCTNGSTSTGAVLYRFMQKFHPEQEQVFCFPITKNEKAKCDSLGLFDVAMSPRKPIGKNTIANLAKEAMMISGVSGWERFGLHECRREFVTKVVNSPDVSLASTMDAARHNSVSASKSYQKLGPTAEMNKFKAIDMGYFSSAPTSSKIINPENTFPSATIHNSYVDMSVPSHVLLEQK